MEWINYNERQQLQTIDANKKTVEGVLTTETPVLIFDYNRFDVIREILLVDGMKAPNKIPLLNSHQRKDIHNVIGSTTDFRIVEENGQKKVICRNELSGVEAEIWTKIEEGHIDSTSVGYKVYDDKSVIIGKGEKKEINGRTYENNERIDLVVRTEWMPVENSLVPIGADSQAKLRNNIVNENFETKMNKLIEMQEKLEELTERNEAIFTAKQAEERELTDEEMAAIEANEREIEKVEKQIELEKRYEERKRNQVRKSEGEKIVEKYSVVKAVRMAAGFIPKEGIEWEMHQEAVREAKENGHVVEGIGVPHMIVNPERTYVTSTANAAGDLVQETYRPITEGLLPKLLIGQLGGRITSNKGTITTIKTNYATAAWEGEIEDAASKTLTFTQAQYSPMRLGGYTPVSRTMLIQDGYGLENRMVNDLMNSMKIALDAAAINGNGTTTGPAGILNKSGITTVAMGDNGLAPTRAKLLEMEKGIDTSLADLNGLKFLTTPGVKEYLRNLNVDSGSGLFVWGENNNIIGYPGYTSTQVPSTLTKGSSTSVCHAIILGDFSKVEMAQFGGYDIVVDPYSNAVKNIVNVWANSYWNVIVDYPESFAVIVDALTS